MNRTGVRGRLEPAVCADGRAGMNFFIKVSETYFLRVGGQGANELQALGRLGPSRRPAGAQNIREGAEPARVSVPDRR